MIAEGLGSACNDYGKGLITDWGVHLIDVINWYLYCGRKGPWLTFDYGQYINVEVPEKEQAPDAFVNRECRNFVTSFSNVNLPLPGGPRCRPTSF